jgi:regulator of replication initiation timing
MTEELKDWKTIALNLERRLEIHESALNEFEKICTELLAENDSLKAENDRLRQLAKI